VDVEMEGNWIWLDPGTDIVAAFLLVNGSGLDPLSRVSKCVTFTGPVTDAGGIHGAQSGGPRLIAVWACA
jgi:hypothetical protein